ncbi:MAG: MBOAT family protein [Candidatus Cloacimonetes bacterium]|nr:MBOAT family protein [Candidatus Cloacimonadota bacterium]
MRSLQVGIILLLLALVLSKYFGLLSDTINSLLEFMGLLPVIKIEKLFIPLGISYITFKHISYLTDIYWGITKRGTFLSFLCYSSFFPIFVAGPIERFERFNPQVSGERHTLSSSDLEFAFRRIVYGLSKKLILADWLGYFIAHNSFLQQDFMLASIIKLLCFSLQIYFDFAGYSDIAIGSSRLFGFKIMENFNNPYLRSNISLFWRNWHISLSDWIRDYLFFPLGGVSRNKFWNIVLVPIIAMGLCGIWHGAAWKFLLWGVWHGIGIAIYQIWQQYKRAHKKQVAFTKSKIWLVLSTAITFAFVTVGWLWFK